MSHFQAFVQGDTDSLSSIKWYSVCSPKQKKRMSLIFEESSVWQDHTRGLMYKTVAAAEIAYSNLASLKMLLCVSSVLRVSTLRIRTFGAIHF